MHSFHIAVPPTLNSSPETVNVYHSDEVTLSCPFEFRNSRGILDPLEVSWWLNEGTNTSSYQVSNDGGILHVTASHAEIFYQCRLVISRCTWFDENDQVHSRCGIESTYMGPKIQFNLLGKLQVVY